MTNNEADLSLKNRRLTIYLMQEDIEEFDDALDEEKPSIVVELLDDSGMEGRFYYLKAQPMIPPWVGFVQPVLADQITNLKASSTSALLLLRVSQRVFALTFGYGRSLLDLSKIEYQFGLRVALNSIDPRQIRSLDTKTFEDLVVSTNTQASKSSDLPTFSVDVTRDVLRAVTGEAREDNLSGRIAGADSLVVSTKLTITDLPGFCSQLLEAFESEAYKEDFAWIDQLAMVRDPRRVDALNNLLVNELQSGSALSTHLAMPETIDWEDIDGFKISPTRQQVYEDLDIDLYLQHLGDEAQQITLEKLKSRQVSVRFGRSQNFDKRWNLYQCIVSEQRYEGSLHVLIDGRWFVVSSSLVEEVDSFMERLPAPRVRLIPARVGEIEGDYNRRLAASSGNRLLNLDAKIKRPGGAKSGIEFCDLLSSDGDIIHVKRKSRSATLSHLFAQGSVSATTFTQDGVFRDEIRKIIGAAVSGSLKSDWMNLVPSSAETINDRSKYRVTFAVVTNSSKPGNDWLPFFSKLNLMQQGTQLKTMGFEVSIARVDVE